MPTFVFHVNKFEPTGPNRFKSLAIEVQAPTVEEARRLAEAQVPAGHFIFMHFDKKHVRP